MAKHVNSSKATVYWANKAYRRCLAVESKETMEKALRSDSLARVYANRSRWYNFMDLIS